jgi:hypothetical protein
MHPLAQGPAVLAIATLVRRASVRLATMKLWKKRANASAERYARQHGYFWLPCPICGQMFGGHEWGSEHQTLMLDASRGVAVCPDCAGSPRVLESEERAEAERTARWAER